MNNVWVIAHRGGGGLFRENTLSAFQQAELLGVDMVECDIHASQDGQLMVIHDATLERTGGNPMRVDQLTAAALKKIDVGDGQGVPTLPELLETIAIPLVVEIKTPAVMPGLISLLRHNPGYLTRIVPISFMHDTIKALRDRFPMLEAGVLLVGRPVDMKSIADAAHVRLLSLYYELVDERLVSEMHQHGILVSVWTPNTRKDIAAAMNIGVDGITSDRPDWVLEAVQRAPRGDTLG
ncbi:MAG: glycerophosphodiester phosphodiesterase [Firmicutes bacterium]|nr:glycerophosphodiester phosphodiesterase [Bacillota bacterium]